MTDWTLRECHEEVADADGHAQPCNRCAEGWRVDPEENKPYPVCVTHHRWPYADEWVALTAKLDAVRALAGLPDPHNVQQHRQYAVPFGPGDVRMGVLVDDLRAALDGGETP